MDVPSVLSIAGAVATAVMTGPFPVALHIIISITMTRLVAETRNLVSTELLEA